MYTKYLDFLKQLLSISSQSRNFEGINAVGNFFIRKTKNNIKWENLEINNDFSLFWGRFYNNFNTQKTNILLSAHLDTVYPAQDIEVIQKKNKLYGSGAYDMKSSLITILEVIDRIKSQNLKINLDIILSPDEERGPKNISREILKKIAKNYKYIFVLESSIDKEPKLYRKKRTIVGSRAGTILFDIRIVSPGGHSGVLNKKNERFSSIIQASKIIQELEKVSDYRSGKTFNVGIIKGGTAVNVLASNVYMQAEARIKKQEEFKRVIKTLQNIQDKYSIDPFKVIIEEKGIFPVMTLSKKEEMFFNKLKEKVKKKYDIDLQLTFRSGGSEGNYFELGNKDAIIFDGFGPVGENQHTTQEFVYLDSIQNSVDILLQAILLAQNYKL